jgi:hypothetical protein
MKRGVRRLACVGVALCVVALAFGVTVRVVDSLEPPGVTESNLRRIRPGMTLAEAEAIFGGPASGSWSDAASSRDSNPPRLTGYVWQSDGGWAAVNMGGDNRVREAWWTPSGKPQPSPLDRFRAWLGW